jgi:hypothetical protein
MLAMIACIIAIICLTISYIFVKQSTQHANSGSHDGSNRKAAHGISIIENITRVIRNRIDVAGKVRSKHNEKYREHSDTDDKQQSNKPHCQPPTGEK